MNVQISEMEVLRVLRPQYEALGYEVAEQSKLPRLPDEFANYIPDLVMTKGDEFLAFEVKNRRIPSVHKRLEKLKSALEKNPQWSFRIVYSSDVSMPKGPSVQSVDEIEGALASVRKILESDQPIGAFLLAWATFEAASRLLYSKIFAKPQSPGRLVTVLAEKGIIDTDDAASLRSLLAKRNSLIHGELSVPIRQPDVLSMIDATQKVLEHSK